MASIARTSIARATSATSRPTFGTSTVAARIVTQAPTSGVRATLPSERACLRRFGVGFSVFSPLIAYRP
ncbi:hypothetical protein GCM10025868_41850 [Angustibacter aerolatus]|uniref:Uncharacterized protein n=1 Tax=Angustibacter aerolatus TaxID=1162965 RepID=A0ABQ6JKZ6_9ACTN|nr:hypothetical protein GCM10025868_41850 [Angustibacter aerolatus]